MTTLSPEAALLCAALSFSATEASIDDLGAAANVPLNWNLAAELAIRNRVTVPVCASIKSAGLKPAVPSHFPLALRRHIAAMNVCNLKRTIEMIRISERCNAAEIAVLWYKGPVLSQALYGNVAAREFGDLDLLIDPQDIGSITDLLLAEGYRPGSALTAWQENAIRSFHNEIEFYHPDKDLTIECHWSFRARHYYLPLDAVSLRERAQSTEILGGVVQTLSPEDTLLLLSVSGAGHGWRRLALIGDIAAKLRKGEVDLTATYSRAKQLRCGRMVRLAVALARRFAAAPVPEWLSSEIDSDPALPALAIQVQQTIFSPVELPIRLIDQTRFYAACCDRTWDAARFVMRAVFTPNARDLAPVTLPSALTSVYYLIRPLRLAAGAFERSK